MMLSRHSVFTIVLMTAALRAQVARSGSLLDSIQWGAQIEGGIRGNPARPANGVNAASFIGDRANQAELNQLTLTAIRPVDRSRADYQWGFSLRLLYGADARYYNIAGVSDKIFTGREQLMPVMAHIDAHLPWATPRGLDMQAGILTAPMGVENLDPMTRPFYSLAYTTEYSTPFEHVGAMFQWHVTPRLDVQFGIDTGNQTSFGHGDNNRMPAGYFGMSMSALAAGRLSFTYLSRVGSENAVRALGPRADHAQRFWNDLNGSYKVTSRLTATAEVNVLHDAGLRADTWSVVGWLNHQTARTVALNLRAEIYRDNSGAIVTTFLRDAAYERALLGDPAIVQNAAPTTYGALTLGATWTPAIGHHVKTFAIRPEIRFDRSLNGTRPFNDLRQQSMFTFGSDVVLGF
ncbi:outer membrane beta-barrel protein [Neoasaia chiangmaiensis]|nr:outer membrane beta-barrel protein [Neoasaia chiangmaiensis]